MDGQISPQVIWMADADRYPIFFRHSNVPVELEFFVQTSESIRESPWVPCSHCLSLAGADASANWLLMDALHDEPVIYETNPERLRLQLCGSIRHIGGQYPDGPWPLMS